MGKRLTKEGLEKLKKKLKRKEEKRKEISDELKEATSQGDLSENAAYDGAQRKYRANEEKIKELRKVIAEAEVVEKEETDEVQLGSFVRVKSGDEEEEYQIVGSEEADISDNKVSVESPLGESLLGKKEGETVTIETPKGEKKYEILKVN